jgi:hypothetical protein
VIEVYLVAGLDEDEGRHGSDLRNKFTSYSTVPTTTNRKNTSVISKVLVPNWIRIQFESVDPIQRPDSERA